jgi:HK97 family phage major capsid protein
MELNEAIDELRGEIRQFNEEAVNPIKERLASLEERGTAPSDEKVTDLESRLAEQNDKLADISETLRLVQANEGLIKPKVETKSDPFKGMFFRDVDAVRAELLHGESRAIAVADIASAGKLTDETASAFLDYVVGDQPTLSVIERRTMNSPTARLDRIGVGSRQLVAATENTAPTDTDSISFAARSLSVTEAIWAEDISWSFLEDNIAGGNAEQQIANVVAKAIGEELNDLAWNGDGSTGTFLAINTGFETLLNADSDVSDVDQTSNTTALTALNALYKAMPSQYRTIGDQRIFCSPGFATEYMEALGNRATALGDTTLTGGSSGLAYFGIPITVDRHLDADKIYMTPASNLVVGFHRDVTQEMEWNPRKRQIELTFSMRFDYQYKFGGVVARGHTLDSGLE